MSILASTAGLPGTINSPVPVDAKISRLHRCGFCKANC
jgi:hypothetical protein